MAAILEVYPRTGGGNRSFLSGLTACGGLSPHGWGKHAMEQHAPHKTRSIPARAGETAPQLLAPCVAWVYPRTGGGNTTRDTIKERAEGLSPHGRGKLHHRPEVRDRQRSIPARAGETGRVSAREFLMPVYPRTGGGNSPPWHSETCYPGLSPHGRGKPEPGRQARRYLRSIPARAGETSQESPAGVYVRVYPRTGGGNG